MLQRELHRLGTRDLVVKQHGASKSVTVPRAVDNRDINCELGTEMKPFVAEVTDPDTGKKKTAIAYIPKDE